MLRLTQKSPARMGGDPADAGVTSQLCLADLGGSEQLKKSGAEGLQKAEAVQINLGLLALKVSPGCVELTQITL